MGKAGRFACIFTPMALTIASLVCLIIVGLGGTNKNNSSFNNLYFFRANTSDINVDPSLINLPSNDITDKLGNITGGTVKAALDIKDFYHVHLWNYCDGDFGTNSTGGVSESVTYCSPHTNEFWFNPVSVWGLNNTGVDQFFSKELRAGLATYKTVTKWMFIAYIVALISTIAEILVGFLALFSRLGSVATTIVSTISSLFVVGFALTSTILYATLASTFNSALKKYSIHGSLGHSIYVAIWLAVAFSWAAGLFWLFSSCCCSGRSDRIKGYGDEPGRRRMRHRDAPYQYERVESPIRGGLGYGTPQQKFQGGPGFQAPNAHHAMPLGNVGQQRGTAYEPFRHEGA
ncbi:hypothetical protein MMC21_004206 [Puttea exsequens]|nr:hypothetical protein [Puttea exsequens]